MSKLCKVTSADGSAIRIGKVRFSYVHVFEPNDDGFYSMQLLIPKDNEDAVDLVKSAIKAAAEKGKSSKWDGKIPNNLKKPLRDGDEEHEGEETYEGMYFLNCKNKMKPKVVADDAGMAVECGESEFYSGVWGVVTLQFFPYSNNGNKGIGVSLGNVMKLEDGERLGGGSESTQDSFGDLLD